MAASGELVCPRQYATEGDLPNHSIVVAIMRTMLEVTLPNQVAMQHENV